jgi:hypothetical protein
MTRLHSDAGWKRRLTLAMLSGLISGTAHAVATWVWAHFW